MAGFGGLIRGSWLGRLLRRYDDGRGVAASVITSVLARMASAVTTLLAMPVALNTLGPDRFAAFLVLLGFISWLSLGNLGVGAALARLLAAGEEAEDSRALIGAALVSATVTIGVFSILISLALFGWSHAQAGSLNAPRGELILAAGVLVALTAVQSVLQVFEGVLTGRLQIYTINLMRLAGSAFTLIALLTLPRLWGSMAVFVIAINGGVFVSTLLNAMVALRSARPTFRALHLNLGRIRRLAVSGFAFVVISVASLFQTHLPMLILSQQQGVNATTDFGLLIRLLMIMMAVLGMVTGPLWPALARARADGDSAWVRDALRKSGAFVMAAGLGACVMVGLFGRPIIRLWTGHELEGSAVFQAAFGCYFLQMAWSHYWGVILVGLGRERLLAGLLFAEGVLIVALAWIGAHQFGAAGAIIGMVTASAMVSNWMLPLVALRRLRQEWRPPAASGTGERR